MRGSDKVPAMVVPNNRLKIELRESQFPNSNSEIEEDSKEVLCPPSMWRGHDLTMRWQKY